MKAGCLIRKKIPRQTTGRRKKDTETLLDGGRRRSFLVAVKVVQRILAKEAFVSREGFMNASFQRERERENASKP